MKIDGTVVLRKSSVEDVKDCVPDSIFEKVVYFQLVSRDKEYDGTDKGKVSPHKAYLNGDFPKAGTDMSDITYKITFDWPHGYGTPGAILVRNKHSQQFLLEYVSIYVPGHGDINFLCNSWVYPKSMANSGPSDKRIFFENKSYLPEETPKGLKFWRGEELLKATGGADEGVRQPCDRIYSYDVYNDLGEPVIVPKGSKLPYPRRCRTGRKKKNGYETRESQGFYIPSDEKSPTLSKILTEFSVKLSFYSKSKEVSNPNVLEKHFNNLEKVKSLYKGDPKQMEKEISSSQDMAKLFFPKPNIIGKDDNAWRKDEEFGRQTLSGTNPMVIKRLEKFPPCGNLNPEDYGPQQSSITETHLSPSLEKMSVEKNASRRNDVCMPYVKTINQDTTCKIYATRIIFFLLPDGTLTPIAIELCLPKKDKQLFTPDYSGDDEGWLWELAKAHVRCNDSGYHQLVNHWLRTHAVVEPFIIATHRNLSKVHPLHKLLVPHFRNTMHINSAARQLLINAGGIIEKSFRAGQFAMEISSKAYVDWKFNEKGLPADLIKRGMATENEGKLELVIKDYPYAVDGLEIWDAMKSWVVAYISLYYSDEESVKCDKEVQEWWKEIKEKGHEDKKNDEAGWYKMDTRNDLSEAITTLIWVASAHHAAVNFGQYDYSGSMRNHPSTTRKLVPTKGSYEYDKFLLDPEAYFLKTVTDPVPTTISMIVLQVLSTHSADEVYLGQGSSTDWIDDPRVDIAFKEFGQNLLKIEEKISCRNKDPSLKNRCGAANLPYTLLFPNTSDKTKTGGRTFKGIPNSISI
ncbi:linoleate 9S-lipoxygenase-like [Cryptomeria japonica]|uniref:linoleate 9S-lipoxygenase-like n=1 Tax=Cryptomeria japonica TaxID=3369 RepID=UPI0025ABAB92|nr:linoleate 9S-lipoxygenase-like [Cryptomeria japonica]